ncbi:MAG: chromosome segregation protein SMC [Parachlamydiaceae bacterium]
MKLKEIEIVGFKSFADKTRLSFDPGITAVVGPNGCGKSNISDAFRWVLGEQSAKSMRGTKMPDVIFAGTTHRKPLNFAEVTITFTDVDGKLPIDFEEVSITRRLHRSGDSDYFINRHPVRLKDVQSLLMDSGIGKDTYSIFEQGKIDQVINLTPLERRYIFEEAAGILRFLQRKKEALRKLELTDQNVDRVKDIHNEVERQIVVLEEQAAKAYQYKENKKVLDKLEKGLLVVKWDGVHCRLGELNLKARGQDENSAAINGQIEVLYTQLTEAKQKLEEAEKGLRARREEVFTVRSTKEISTKEKQNNQERLKELDAKEKRWQIELEGSAERRKRREEERKALQRATKETTARLQAQEDVVKIHRSKVKGLEEELVELRSHQQSRQKELFRLVQTENQHESLMRQITVRLENAQEKHAQIQDRKKSLSHAQQEQSQQAAEKEVALQEAIQTSEKKKEIFVTMELRLQEISEESSKAQEEIDKLYRETAEAKARLKALQRLREDMEGFSSGSKKLLNEAASQGSPLFGKIKGLYEYIIPEKGAEAAIATVMKPYAQTLVVETEADFTAVVAYMGQHKIKDVSLLCASGLEASKQAGRKDKTLAPLFKNVLENTLARHLLNDVYISTQPTSPMESVKNHAGIDVWIGDGILVDRRSVVFYASQGENNVFMREAEIKTVDKKVRDNELKMSQLEKILEVIQKNRQQLIGERTDLDKVIRREEMKLVEYNFSLQKATADLEKTRAHEKQLTVEWDGVSSSIEKLKSSLVETGDCHATAKQEAAAAQQQAELYHKQVEELSVATRSQVISLREKESALQSFVDEQRKQTHGLHVLEVQDNESTQQEMRLAEEIEMGRALQGQITMRKSEVDELLMETEQALAHVQAVCQELEQDVASKKTALNHTEIKINEKRQGLKKVEMERHQVGIQTAQLESHIAALEKELQERHQLSIPQARDESGALEMPAETAEKQVKALRQQIANSGDINMTSIEECEKHKSRYQFLNQQIDDLDLSRKQLIAIIADLDGESRKIFQETFEQVRSNFKKNFEILFHGGEADLQFTDSSDVLEAGIEITAKPPGKQMRSINLLSGGEKCLTAMALLFAIFEVKSAPFCILDEIDAPLDDTNVDRFVNIVKQFVDRCQFIIITHNKRTMAIADVICGVSMEERGVSKLISMNFSAHGEPVLAAT